MILVLLSHSLQVTVQRRPAWGGVRSRMTGWGREADKCQSKKAGFNFHMVKPVDPNMPTKVLAGPVLAPA
jgi:hypothetical protein